MMIMMIMEMEFMSRWLIDGTNWGKERRGKGREDMDDKEETYGRMGWDGRGWRGMEEEIIEFEMR